MPSNKFFPMDGPDEARVVIDTVHHEIHDGHVFVFHHENLAPASGLNTIIHIKTGTKKPHMFLDFEALGGVLSINMYDGATVGTAGSAISVFNRNRNFGTTGLTTLIYLNSTVGTTGTAFATRAILASATAQGKVTSAVREGAERVWEPNKDYVISLLTRAASMSFTVDGIFEEE